MDITIVQRPDVVFEHDTSVIRPMTYSQHDIGPVKICGLKAAQRKSVRVIEDVKNSLFIEAI